MLFCFFNNETFAQSKDTLVNEFSAQLAASGDQKIRIVNEQQMLAKTDFDKGFAHNSAGEFNEGISTLKKAIEIDYTGNCGSGDDGAAFNELGYAYTRLKNYDSARLHLDKAIALNPSYTKAYLNKSVVFMQQKQFDESIAVLNTLLQAKPDLAMVFAQRGFVYKAKGDTQHAIEDFKKYLELTKDKKQDDNMLALRKDVEKQLKKLENPSEK